MDGQHDTHLDEVLHRKCRLEPRVYLPHRPPNLSGRSIAAKYQRYTHRVVISLKKVAHSVDGFRIGCKATEEVDEILVAHT